MEPSKTRTSFYRRLYVAWLISQGTDTVPAIMEATGMPRRTAQDTLSAGRTRYQLRLRADRGGSPPAGALPHQRLGSHQPGVDQGSTTSYQRDVELSLK